MLISRESSLGQDVVELHVLGNHFYFRKFMQRKHGFRPMVLLEKSAKAIPVTSWPRESIRADTKSFLLPFPETPILLQIHGTQ
jgi:hypothetical protein